MNTVGQRRINVMSVSGGVEFFLIGAAAAWSPQDRIKRDVLVMKNVDRLTAEIKNWRAASSSSVPDPDRLRKLR
jgi:hypothetical protein